MVNSFSKLKMNMEGLTKFFNDNGIEVSSQDAAKIKSIFEECDVENTKSENKSDGQLTGNERANFMKKIAEQCSNLYHKILGFLTTVESEENKEIERQKLEAVEVEMQDERRRIEEQLDRNQNPDKYKTPEEKLREAAEESMRDVFN